jgi:hypothetical protein
MLPKKQKQQVMDMIMDHGWIAVLQTVIENIWQFAEKPEDMVCEADPNPEETFADDKQNYERHLEIIHDLQPVIEKAAQYWKLTPEEDELRVLVEAELRRLNPD